VDFGTCEWPTRRRPRAKNVPAINNSIDITAERSAAFRERRRKHVSGRIRVAAPAS
jgi:hypothetical protein